MGRQGEPSVHRAVPPPREPPRELPVLAVAGPVGVSTAGRPTRVPPPPWVVGRGVVLFDLDGTLLDDLALIAGVAADVLHKTFGTTVEEARIHYLATTGMPFEAQLAQLYPQASPELRSTASRTFHQRKVTEAYARAKPFPEVPKLLKTLASARWNLAVTTGAETEMAELLLEREGIRYWFDDVLGSAQGTKREHLAEYRRRYGNMPIFLVGDSRFDMEAAVTAAGVQALGRASSIAGWTLTPQDLRRWGASWAAFSLAGLPVALEKLTRAAARPASRNRTPSRRK